MVDLEDLANHPKEQVKTNKENSKSESQLNP